MALRARPASILLCAVCAAACATRFDPRLADAPVAGRPWVSTRNTANPLVGKILEPGTGRFVDEAALTQAITSADFVLLGETHDNPDHHLLEARMVREIIAAGRRPAVAFEMLDGDQQAAIDASLASHPRDPDALAAAVRWDTSGWPEFEYYRPIFAAALDAGLPIVAANLPRAAVRDLVTKGTATLDEGTRARLAREEPLDARVLEQLRGEMRDSHCGALPDAMVDPLVLAQRAKDARMAGRMLEAGAGRGAVLVTGAGHARRDRGVPAVLARDAPASRILSLAFVEASDHRTDPADYAKEFGAGALPFDFVVFTPGAKREDPCEGMPERMKKLRAKGAAAGAR